MFVCFLKNVFGVLGHSFLHRILKLEQAEGRSSTHASSLPTFMEGEK